MMVFQTILPLLSLALALASCLPCEDDVVCPSDSDQVPTIRGEDASRADLAHGARYEHLKDNFLYLLDKWSTRSFRGFDQLSPVMGQTPTLYNASTIFEPSLDCCPRAYSLYRCNYALLPIGFFYTNINENCKRWCYSSLAKIAVCRCKNCLDNADKCCPQVGTCSQRWENVAVSALCYEPRYDTCQWLVSVTQQCCHDQNG